MQDQEIVEWQMICGTAFRLVLPDKTGEEDEAPFEMYTLDPRDTFIVYSNEIGNEPLMAVKYSRDDNDITHYSIYTKKLYFLIDDGIIKEETPHALDMIPILNIRRITQDSARLRLCFPSSILSTTLKATAWTVWSKSYRRSLSL